MSAFQPSTPIQEPPTGVASSRWRGQVARQVVMVMLIGQTYSTMMLWPYVFEAEPLVSLALKGSVFVAQFGWLLAYGLFLSNRWALRLLGVVSTLLAALTTAFICVYPWLEEGVGSDLWFDVAFIGVMIMVPLLLAAATTWTFSRSNQRQNPLVWLGILWLGLLFSPIWLALFKLTEAFYYLGPLVHLVCFAALLLAISAVVRIAVLRGKPFIEGWPLTLAVLWGLHSVSVMVASLILLGALSWELSGSTSDVSVLMYLPFVVVMNLLCVGLTAYFTVISRRGTTQPQPLSLGQDLQA